MTKDEFYEDINDIDSLVSFCYRHGCSYIVENLKHSDDFDDWIWDQLEEMRSRWYWYDLRSALNDIDAPNTEYFIPGAEFEFTEVDDRELGSYMDDVIDWGDENGFWDEEDEECIETGDDDADDSGDECWDVSVDISVLIGI